MKYHLSARQLKELANGKTLCIALPLPKLPFVEIRRLIELPADIVIIRPIESIVRVDPLTRPSGLAKLLGTIIQDDRPRLQIELTVQVVSFHLAARREQRGYYPTQWPGSVTLDDGRQIP